MAEVPTVLMICENMTGPYAYEIYAIKISHLHHQGPYSRRRSRSSSRHRHRSSGSSSRHRHRSSGSSSRHRHRHRSSSSSSRHHHRHRSPSRSSRRRAISIPSSIYQMKRKLYPRGMGFFSIGSKIYMIGGDDKVGELSEASNRVFVYDTMESSIEERPPMVSGKSHPIVIGPVEGKFYIMSYNLTAPNGFEVFDPEDSGGTWLQLPHPPCVPAFPRGGGGGYRVRPPPEYEIEAHVVVGSTILVSTHSYCVFSFDLITNTWREITDSVLPFVGRAVYAYDYDQLWYGFSYYHYADDVEEDSDFPLFAFRLDHHPCKFVGAGIKKLPNPTGPLCCVQRQGYVNYLGNKQFCTVRSGHTESPFSYECRPPKHYVTIDLFRIHRSRRSNHLSAADRTSLAFIMDDYYHDDKTRDVRRTIRFAAPI